MKSDPHEATKYLNQEKGVLKIEVV